MNLEEKQRAMRERQGERRIGRPRTPAQLNEWRLEKRLRAHRLLCRGWSPARVAAELRVDVRAIEQWISLGQPLTKYYWRGGELRTISTTSQ